MKYPSKLFPLYLIVFLCISCAFKNECQAQTAKLTFHVAVPNTSPDSIVYISGSLPEFGNWDPGKVALTHQRNNIWSGTFTVKSGQSFSYKFTRGSWAREAADHDKQPLPNFNNKISKDTTINHSIKAWTSPGTKRVFNGQVTGSVAYHEIPGAYGLKDRKVVVWMPPGYEGNSSASYPVIYMQDGQNIFDPLTSAFGTDWQIDETADSLIRSAQVQPAIIVGIFNTSRRMSEYMPGDTSAGYMRMIVEKIKPMIDNTYRTKRDRSNTIAGGSSAGGVLAFMLVWEYPDVFSKAICMSPAFKISSWDYVKRVQQTEKRKDVLFYIDNGGIALEEQLQPGIDDMLALLQKKGYERGKDFVFVRDAKAEHNEAAWAKRYPAALKFVLKKRN